MPKKTDDVTLDCKVGNNGLVTERYFTLSALEGYVRHLRSKGATANSKIRVRREPLSSNIKLVTKVPMK